MLFCTMILVAAVLAAGFIARGPRRSKLDGQRVQDVEANQKARPKRWVVSLIVAAVAFGLFLFLTRPEPTQSLAKSTGAPTEHWYGPSTASSAPDVPDLTIRVEEPDCIPGAMCHVKGTATNNSGKTLSLPYFLLKVRVVAAEDRNHVLAEGSAVPSGMSGAVAQGQTGDWKVWLPELPSYGPNLAERLVFLGCPSGLRCEWELVRRES